jgi:hypothetical protein
MAELFYFGILGRKKVNSAGFCADQWTANNVAHNASTMTLPHVIKIWSVIFLISGSLSEPYDVAFMILLPKHPPNGLDQEPAAILITFQNSSYTFITIKKKNVLPLLTL